MGGFNFYNTEYFLVHTYEAIGGVHWGELWATFPAWVHAVFAQIAIWGIVITLLLVILIVYTQIRLVMVEHEGFHGKEVHQVLEVEAPVPQTNERWRRIMELASSANGSDWRRAILEADIMLATVLNGAGYEGASVGDQLKMANPLQMSTLGSAWEAHKVRNQVAHGGESFSLTERDTRTAIDQYRRVFEEFGAI